MKTTIDKGRFTEIEANFQRNLKAEIAKAREELAEAQTKLSTLRSSCSHEVIKRAGINLAVCDCCGIGRGWYCEQSPTKNCQYSESYDECDYCGMPEERK